MIAPSNCREEFPCCNTEMGSQAEKDVSPNRGDTTWGDQGSYNSLLAFALLHFVLQDQTCLLCLVSLDFLFLYSNPL